VGHVNKKPQYLVFPPHLQHPNPKQQHLPVESLRNPHAARNSVAQIAANPVQIRIALLAKPVLHLPKFKGSPRHDGEQGAKVVQFAWMPVQDVDN
jgi:hypothetical protein